jgi:hypothetical protein
MCQHHSDTGQSSPASLSLRALSLADFGVGQPLAPSSACVVVWAGGVAG